MARSRRELAVELRRAAADCTPAGAGQQLKLLAVLATTPFRAGPALGDFANVLMFIATHPRNRRVRDSALAGLDRLAEFMRRQPLRARNRLENSGLPYTPTLSTYSHDHVAWMLRSQHYRIRFDSFWRPEVRLSQALALTLPTIERDACTTGYEGRQLLDHLVPDARHRLPFLIAEFARFDDRPALKDFLFDGLHLYLRLTPTDHRFSRAFNRLEMRAPFYHRAIVKSVDPARVIRRRLPAPRALEPDEAEAVTTVARQAMMLLERETDPTTHLDVRSLRVYDLGRGVSVAIYGMVAARQLPLESYVGYTLFKNGYPAAYGGAWVFGRHALFGINVFAPFRGGESAFLLCQLLRVYRGAFGVDYFSVEPYQYGQGNPEGIRSGAFWFYYRHGFRPVEPELAALAESERARIAKRRGYRTPPAVLRQLAEGSMALRLGADVPPSIADVRAHITRHINSVYHGDRAVAERQCRRHFVQAIGSPGRLDRDGQRVFTEVALWAECASVRSQRALARLRQMIRVKPQDLYHYQRLVQEVVR